MGVDGGDHLVVGGVAGRQLDAAVVARARHRPAAAAPPPRPQAAAAIPPTPGRAAPRWRSDRAAPSSAASRSWLRSTGTVGDGDMRRLRPRHAAPAGSSRCRPAASSAALRCGGPSARRLEPVPQARSTMSTDGRSASAAIIAPTTSALRARRSYGSRSASHAAENPLMPRPRSRRQSSLAESCQVGRFAAAACARRRQTAPLFRVFDQHPQRVGERLNIVRARPARRRSGGTVSGMAPAVVPITGRPCAIASAKAMP